MSLQKIEEIFSREGLLSRVLAPGFEWRPQQEELALSVFRTLRDGGNLLAEAPTGVGKTLAYLVPGILWAQENRQTFVVSTYTRGLQDQILDQDLPHVRRMIEREIRAVVLKGRANYLCRSRWQQYIEEQRGTVEGEELERALGLWTQVTETGDLAEAPLPAGKGAARVQAAFPRICGESRFCSTGRCSPDGGCFFKRSRQAAREAHLVIINHSLLLIELFSGAAGLPDFELLVVDEGHHLPRVAVEPLSMAVSESALDSALKGLGGRGEPGLTEQLRRLLRAHPSQVEKTEALASLRELETETGRLALLARAFWSELAGSMLPPSGESRLRYGPGTATGTPFPSSGIGFCDQFDRHLEALEKKIEECRRLRRSAPEGEMLAAAEADRLLEEGRAVGRNLGELLTPDRGGFVYWMEKGSGGASLHAAPCEVGPHLRDALFRRKRAVVLTSATLALEGQFEHQARKLGLDPDGYEGLILPTPFHLAEQVAARIVTGVPEPNDPAFADALAQGIELLARRARRKMLVLFTSHDALRRVEARVRAPLTERGIRLHAQGVDGGHRQVRAGFREQGPAVLLGAASFWEGVDFPGEELEILLMARLPFLVPTDPLVEAMGERLQAEGQDPFRAFQLPEAMIRFRQGFGRLIRRVTDRGLFAVIDPRLQSRNYGARFQRAVGVPFRVVPGWEELAAEAESWFQVPPGA